MPEKLPVFPNVQAQKVQEHHRHHRGYHAAQGGAKIQQDSHKHHCYYHQQLHFHPDFGQPRGQHVLKVVAVLAEGEQQRQQRRHKQNDADSRHRQPPGILPVGQVDKGLSQAAGQLGVQGDEQQHQQPGGQPAQQKEEAYPGDGPLKHVGAFGLSAFQICIQSPTPPSNTPAPPD